MNPQNINPITKRRPAKIPTTGALLEKPNAFAFRKYGPTILPTWPKSAIRGNPLFAASGDVISVTIAQKSATINEPKLSTQIYQTHPITRYGLFMVLAKPMEGSEKQKYIISAITP